VKVVEELLIKYKTGYHIPRTKEKE